MIASDSQIATFTKIAENSAEVLINRDYGADGLLALQELTIGIRSLYRNLALARHKKVTVFKALGKESITPSLNVAFDSIVNSSTFTTVVDEELVVELRSNGEYYRISSDLFDVTMVRQKSVVYCYENDIEKFYGKSDVSYLQSITGVDSYFSISTFKSLDEALEYYKVNFALNSTCEKIDSAWIDNKTRIFLGPRPEFALRDSLYYFLKIRLRGNVEYSRESNMDDTHPVDIKLSWNYTSHIAIIEVKWIGKSLKGAKVTSHNESRALSGAKQLAEYLDMINKTTSDKITRGYLVVFDVRRNKTNARTKEIDYKNGYHYENLEIDYNPEYHKIQELNFAKPLRFFIKPICKP